jgi:hypothetical protein
VQELHSVFALLLIAENLCVRMADNPRNDPLAGRAHETRKGRGFEIDHRKVLATGGWLKRGLHTHSRKGRGVHRQGLEGRVIRLSPREEGR